jgi:hypothetical protein
MPGVASTRGVIPKHFFKVTHDATHTLHLPKNAVHLGIYKLLQHSFVRQFPLELAAIGVAQSV